MIVLSADASNAALDAIADIMDAGHIELLTGDGRVIVELPLSSPAAMAAVDGELEFNKIFEADAVIAGVATTARIVSAGGNEVLLCDIGTQGSGAVIELGTTSISIGTPVRISSFKIAMP